MSETALPLEGHRVVVTGSSRGLGEAIARQCAAQGARVVVNGTDRARCERVAAEIGGVAIPGPIGEEATADHLVDGCCDAFGGIDGLVNNAGITRDRTLTRMSAEAFDEVLRVHLRGTWLMSQRAARAMGDGGGTIVNVVSGTALYGHAGQSNYAAAKGGALGLTRALSVELARRAIRVNAVAPIARTAMVEPLFAVADDAEEKLGSFFGDPADVAGVFAFLLSESARALTGQVVGFDGHRLVLWSHPTPIRDVREQTWTSDGFRRAFAGGPVCELQPDALSLALNDVLRAAALARTT